MLAQDKWSHADYFSGWRPAHQAGSVKEALLARPIRDFDDEDDDFDEEDDGLDKPDRGKAWGERARTKDSKRTKRRRPSGGSPDGGRPKVRPPQRRRPS